MAHRRWLLRRFSTCLLACTLGVIGCGASSSDGEATEQDLVPESPGVAFEKAPVCAGTLKRHELVRAMDLKDGSIRWNCADVPGVTTVDAAKCAKETGVDCQTFND